MRANYFEFIGFRLAREHLGRRGVKELPDLPDSLRFAQRNAFTLRVLRLTASPRGSSLVDTVVLGGDVWSTGGRVLLALAKPRLGPGTTAKPAAS